MAGVGQLTVSDLKSILSMADSLRQVGHIASMDERPTERTSHAISGQRRSTNGVPGRLNKVEGADGGTSRRKALGRIWQARGVYPAHSPSVWQGIFGRVAMTTLCPTRLMTPGSHS